METKDIELHLLIEAIRLQYGHDLNSYALPSLNRRLQQALNQLGFSCIADLIPWILHDSYHYSELLNKLSITVTEMFRDPDVFKILREEILPTMKINPYLKFWIAGCATGEEAYSLAILLHEENLLEKSLIFATDINLNAINKAKDGIYNKDLLVLYQNNYLLSGGKYALSDYFSTSRFNTAKIKDYLKQKIVFAQHDLSKEKEFSEVHMVMCRNVLMYFNQVSQRRIISIFKKALYDGGYLSIGKREILQDNKDVLTHYMESKIFKLIKSEKIHSLSLPQEIEG